MTRLEHRDLRWLSPPESLVLSDQEVHVWCAFLDRHTHLFESLTATLSSDECDRANRFRFERDRIRFTLGRGILRSILSRYFNVEPGELEFAYSDRGKPALVQSIDSQRIEFNVSHSHQLALFAIALHTPIGVDVEHIRPIEVLPLADRFFLPTEAAQLAKLPLQQQQLSFFQRWTCKEAYLKAIGTGLVGLEQTEIQIDNSQQPYLVREGAIVAEWQITPLPVSSDYAAHLVSQSHVTTVHLWEWQPNLGEQTQRA